MKLDKVYSEQLGQSTPSFSDLPYDYFYTNEYEYLTLPEAQLLLILADSKVSYTFSGLRKKTQLHQYRISKSLKRLQDRDLIHKNEGGTYSLTPEGGKFTRRLINELVNQKTINPSYIKHYIKKIRIELTPRINQSALVSKLSGRWFSDFRFLYMKENGEYGLELCWEDNENDQVLLLIQSNSEVAIESKFKQPREDKVQVFVNWIARELMVEVKVDNEETEKKPLSSYDKEIYN
ncbi:MAG: hypothetical protein ACTSQE_08030 [Candidatus Heimdallarchaeaceae archaeon]